MAALDATRTAATAWNASHEDPDLAADLMLVAQYRTNLQTYAGTAGPRTLGECSAAGEPYPPPGVPIGEPRGNDVQRFACSSGGASGGLPVALVAFAACLRRRRR
jgi:uncharacterized protein (TIGR03382 family)